MIKLKNKDKVLFSRSKVVDKNYELISTFIGLNDCLESLESKNLIKKDLGFGEGYYFTTNYDEAVNISLQDNNKKNKKGFVYEAYLNLKNPIIINDNDCFSSFNILQEHAIKILEKLPEFYVPFNHPLIDNPLNQYIKEFNIDTKKDIDFNIYIKKFAEVHYNNINLAMLFELFAEHLDILYNSLNEIYGYDGLAIISQEKIEYVVWFKDDIKIIDTHNIKIKEEFYIDKNNNKWEINKYESMEEILKYSKSLKNCKNCLNCKYCVNCEGCKNCDFCNNCVECWSCEHCINLSNKRKRSYFTS